jgi:hypothetical protein
MDLSDMDLADLIKVIIATGAYFVVLGAGVAVAWWMARRARRKEQGGHE